MTSPPSWSALPIDHPTPSTLCSTPYSAVHRAIMLIRPLLPPAYRATTRTHQVFLPIFDDLAESLTGQQAGGTAAAHTFVQDADEAAVCHNGHGASDSSPGEIEPRSAEIGEIALEQRPGSGAPADFTRRRLSMASGMTMEAHEA